MGTRKVVGNISKSPTLNTTHIIIIN